MQIVIDIPEEDYKTIIQRPKQCFVHWDIVDALRNGTPLDDVKEEMEKAKRFHVGTFENDNPIDYGIVEGFDKAIEILDNIGKAESEDKE